MGTNLDEQNVDVQAKFSALQLQRQKFLNAMRNTKSRENETMAKFNDFVTKINKSKTQKTGGGGNTGSAANLSTSQQWMAKPL